MSRTYVVISVLGSFEDSRIKFCQNAETNHSQWNYQYIPHGTKLVPSVTCVNNVELENTEDGNTIIVSFKDPLTDKATIEFIVQDDSFQVNHLPVQTDLSRLDFRWTGFHDTSGITSFDCKLQAGDEVIRDWTREDQKDYKSLRNLKLKSNAVYTVFIRAKNIGNKISALANASVYISSENPRLTGKMFRTSTGGFVFLEKFGPEVRVPKFIFKQID